MVLPLEDHLVRHTDLVVPGHQEVLTDLLEVVPDHQVAQDPPEVLQEAEDNVILSGVNVLNSTPGNIIKKLTHYLKNYELNVNILTK